MHAVRAYVFSRFARVQIVSRRVVYEPRPGEVGVQSVMTAESLAV